MHQSAASPWGSPPGTTENPGTFVEIVRYLLPEVVGKISLLFIEIAPQGQTLGICRSAVLAIDDSRMLFEVFTSRPCRPRFRA